MSTYPLASRTGVTKKAIQKAITNGIDEEDIFEFIHGDLNKIQERLPEASGIQRWESTGKRFVHLEEARFVAKHFLRNAIKPENTKALILSGADPTLACLPWAMSGLVTECTACEINPLIYAAAKEKLPKEMKKAKEVLPEGRELKVNLVPRDILEETDSKYGFIDLDFCNNRIRFAIPSSPFTLVCMRQSKWFQFLARG